MDGKIGNETAWITPTEDLAPGYNNKWAIWRSLNRLRTKLGRCKTNLKKWGYLEASLALCECGEEQTMDHLLKCNKCPISCNDKEFIEANQNAANMAQYGQMMYNNSDNNG